MGSDKCAVCVFLLAENRLLLDVFVRLLSRKNDIEVMGATPFTPQAIQQVVAANPDVVVCDSLTSALSTHDLLLDLKRNHHSRVFPALALAQAHFPFMRESNRYPNVNIHWS
jgi:DNA-binding NarL/FixJ family response regulator